MCSKNRVKAGGSDQLRTIANALRHGRRTGHDLRKIMLTMRLGSRNDVKERIEYMPREVRREPDLRSCFVTRAKPTLLSWTDFFFPLR